MKMTFDNKDKFNRGTAGSWLTDSYGDKNYETIKGSINYKIK